LKTEQIEEAKCCSNSITSEGNAVHEDGGDVEDAAAIGGVVGEGRRSPLEDLVVDADEDHEDAQLVGILPEDVSAALN